MKRTTITMDVCGRIAVPSDTANLWMSEYKQYQREGSKFVFGADQNRLLSSVG